MVPIKKCVTRLKKAPLFFQTMEVRKWVKDWKTKFLKMQALKNKTKVNKAKIVMTVEKTSTGFSAFSEDFPIFTTGTSIPELLKNAQEAIKFYFEDKQVNIEPDQMKFEIDFRQFFKYYKVLNAKYLGEKIGMNPSLISQYVSGAKKPSSKQTEKILKGINQIGVELSGIHLLKTE